MTVIAFDGINLVADKAEFFCGVMTEVTKIFMFNDIDPKVDEFFKCNFHRRKILMGLAGRVKDITDFLNALRQGDIKTLNRLAEDKECDLEGIIINVSEGRMFYLYNQLALKENFSLPMVRGSATPFTYGAMIAGLDAVEAVSAAVQYTDHAGLGVNVFTLSDEALTRFPEALYKSDYGIVRKPYYIDSAKQKIIEVSKPRIIINSNLER